MALLAEFPDAARILVSADERSSEDEPDLQQEIVRAADLSRGVFEHHRVRFYDGRHNLAYIMVLDVSRTTLNEFDLQNILNACHSLVKLDASRCGLVQLPQPSLWEKQKSLQVLHLNRNDLKRWQDLDFLSVCHALVWITLFGNPIAGQTQFRPFVLQCCPRLLAVDFRLISDLERISEVSGEHWQGGSISARFVGALLDADDPPREGNFLNLKLEDEVGPEQRLQLQTSEEIRSIRTHSLKSSPARLIQACWRGCMGRRKAHDMKESFLRAVVRLQRGARFVLWRKRMSEYVKGYLHDIDELDLLLDAKEMLRRRALKLIEVSVRRWIRRRSQRMKQRKASAVLGRMGRGFCEYRMLFYAVCDYKRHPGFYFPERHAWEFRLLFNVILKRYRFPPLPPDHEFEESKILGVRFPQKDEVPFRQRTLHALLNFGSHCVLRRLHSGRNYGTAWDGPMHKMVDKAANMEITYARANLRRRGCNLENRSRRAFLASCVSGRHPIHRGSKDEAEDDSHDCLVFKELLEGPESRWPQEELLQRFMNEAKISGCKRWRKNHVLEQGVVDKETGVRCYAETGWLSQRLLYAACPNEKVCLNLAMMLNEFSQLAHLLPSVSAVPVLHEKGVLQVTAATMIQATWRAHRARAKLKCGLWTAVVTRRAVLCIQRAWRWGLVKRRLEMLTGALRVMHSIETTSLYIEERLFHGLNVISSIQRFPRLMKEDELGFGYQDQALALIQRPSGRGGPSPQKALKGSWPARRILTQRLDRRGLLPDWFKAKAGLDMLGGDSEDELQRLSGLQAFVSAGCDRSEENLYTVTSPFLENLARKSAAGGAEKELKLDEVPRNSLVASGGSLRFVELRFASLEQAKQRALLLYLCTYDSLAHMGVVMRPRHQLSDKQIFQTVLRQWELYGFNWPTGSKVGPNHVKQHEPRAAKEAVFANGTKRRCDVNIRAGWLSLEGVEDETGTVHARRRNAIGEAANQRRAAYLESVAQRKRRHFEDVQKQVEGLSDEELFHVLETGHGLGNDDHKGNVEAWVTGERPEFYMRDDPQAAAVHLKEQIKEEKEAIRDLLVQAQEQSHHLAEDQRAWCDSWKETKHKACQQFEARLLDFHASMREESWEEARQMKGNPPTFSMSSTSPSWRERSRQSGLAPIAGEEARMPKLVQEHRLYTAEQERWTQEDRAEAKAMENWSQLQRKQQYLAQEKAAKARRDEVRKMSSTFCSQRHALQRLAHANDRDANGKQMDQSAALHVADVKREWAARTRAMAARQYQTLDHRRKQVNDLRLELQRLAELRSKQSFEEHQAKRASIIERKTLDRLLKVARQQLDDCAREADLRLPSEFAESFSSFQDIKEMVSSVKGADAAVTASTSAGFDQAIQTILELTDYVEDGPRQEHMASSLKLPQASPGRPSPRPNGKAATTSNWKESSLVSPRKSRWRSSPKASDGFSGQDFEKGPVPVSPPSWPQRPWQPTAKRSPRPPGAGQPSPRGWGNQAAAEPWLKRFGGSVMPLSARSTVR